MRLTQKQDRFARFWFDGLSQREAYIKAGYSSRQSFTTIDRHASALSKNDKVVTRYNELRKAADDASVLKVLEINQRLTEIVRMKLTDFMELGQDGSWVNIGPETPHGAAIQEIHSRTEYDENGSHPTVYTSVKLHDPMKAIDLFCKINRIYLEQSPPAGNIFNIGAMQVNVGDPKEQLISILNRLAARMPEAEGHKQPD